jgi:hypothetical protein
MENSCGIGAVFHHLVRVALPLVISTELQHGRETCGSFSLDL